MHRRQRNYSLSDVDGSFVALATVCLLLADAGQMESVALCNFIAQNDILVCDTYA